MYRVDLDYFASNWLAVSVIDTSRTHTVGFHYETYGEISPSRTLSYAFSAQLNFSVSDRYSYEKIHTASLLVRQDGAISVLTTSSLRLKVRAWCGDVFGDEPISPSQWFRMNIVYSIDFPIFN